MNTEHATVQDNFPHASDEALLIFSWCLFHSEIMNIKDSLCLWAGSYYKFYFGTCQWPEQSMPSGTMAGDSLGDWYFRQIEIHSLLCRGMLWDPRETKHPPLSLCPVAVSGWLNFTVENHKTLQINGATNSWSPFINRVFGTAWQT